MAALVVVAVLPSACKRDTPGPPKEEIEALRQSIAAAENILNAKTAAWQKTVGLALAQKAPQHGPKCSVVYDYPAKHFRNDAWVQAGIIEWNKTSLPPRARRVQALVRAATSALDDGLASFALSYLDDLNAVAATEFWTHDLSVQRLQLEVPQQGTEGKFSSGELTVRALLYSYAADKVVCQAVYSVTNQKTIALSFEIIGTQEENRRTAARMAEAKPTSETLSVTVALDLDKRAFHAARSQLRSTQSSPDP